jgi:hypothetical protein
MTFHRSDFAAAVVLVAATSIAHAGDPRCAAPPYGATDAQFHVFVKAFGNIVTVDRMLLAVCNANTTDHPGQGCIISDLQTSKLMKKTRLISLSA